MEQNPLEILLEEMRSKFDLVLEGHDALRQEIRGSEERLSARIDHVDFKLNTLNTKIDQVKTDLRPTAPTPKPIHVGRCASRLPEQRRAIHESPLWKVLRLIVPLLLRGNASPRRFSVATDHG